MKKKFKVGDVVQFLNIFYISENFNTEFYKITGIGERRHEYYIESITSYGEGYFDASELTKIELTPFQKALYEK